MRAVRLPLAGVLAQHGRLQGRERDLRRVLREPQARAVGGPGRASAPRRALRDRGYRQVSLKWSQMDTGSVSRMLIGRSLA